MLINWFTVIAQIVNFLILVWLLKRFLYAPILSAIDAREKDIAAKLASADTKQTEAQKKSDDFDGKSKAFDSERASLLAKATTDAGTERERLLATARKDVDAERSQWQDALRNDQSGLNDEIVRRTRQGVFDIARKTLGDLATVDLETSICGAFITRLGALKGPEHDKLAASLKTPSQPTLVRSAFDLPPAQRATISAAVSKTFAVQPQIQFETAPDLVSGIEMTAGGEKVAWSISDYLRSLEKDVDALVEEKAQPKSDTKPKADAKSETEVKHTAKSGDQVGLEAATGNGRSPAHQLATK